MKLTRKCPSIQHLLFADDSLFLCRATLKECDEFLHCLRLYGEASGQEIKFQKSSITFGSNIDPTMKRLLAERLGIENEGGVGSYLGLSECFSGSKRKLLAFISERLTKRLNGWYSKTLSLGGKEVLLKTIAMALSVYAMSCFRLTKHQCQKLTSAMSSFWWNQVNGKRKIHWVAWKDMCRSKDEGGLGFRDIAVFNQALLAKQAWRILNEPDSLISQLYKGRYFADSTLLDCGKGYRPSYAWRSILYGRELLQKGLYKSIGNGENTGVWTEKWIVDEQPRRPINKQYSYDLNLRVSSLMDAGRSWNLDKLNELFPPMEVQRILNIPTGNLQDQLIWSHSKHGAYTVKSGYWLQATEVLSTSSETRVYNQAEVAVKQRIWKIETQPKIRTFLWRAASGALAVPDRLHSRGLAVNQGFRLCHLASETISHALFQCPSALEIWHHMSIPQPIQGFSDSVIENLSFVFNVMEDSTVNTEIKQSIPWCLWNIWKRRNAILMSATHDSVQVVAQRIKDETSEWFAVIGSLADEDQQLMSSALSEKWLPPQPGTLKCNVNANWRSKTMHSGGAWILRDHTGMARFHARDAFTSSPSKLIAELRTIIWSLQSLKELRLSDVVMVSDCQLAIEAITKPKEWPKYRIYTEHILQLRDSFHSCSIEGEATKCNMIAREIARSVTRDGRFRSYLAIGGPSWLHDRILRESA